MKNLILICGGQSPEHEISIRSAKNILKALDRSKYSVQVIGISKSGGWYLIQEEKLSDEIDRQGEPLFIHPGQKNCFFTDQDSLGDVDVVFPILHGPNGEDGAIQGLLQLLKIPFVGPGVLGSAAAMDKDVAKKLLKEHGLNVADWVLIRKGEDIPSFDRTAEKLGTTMFVKPANMGSSVGVSRVTEASKWEGAIEEALRHDGKVLIETLIEGRELECAVKGNELVTTSGVGEVLSGDVYSYDQKYAESSSAKTIIPADVSKEELAKLKTCAVKAYEALECRGLSRVDAFLTPSGEVYINEVNTMPGFTSISMYPALWEQEGTSYSMLLDELIELALESVK